MLCGFVACYTVGTMIWINENKLSELIFSVTNSPHSDFYRKKYSDVAPSDGQISQKDFISLPMLTRDDLLSTPMEERTFVSPEEVSATYQTSGTSSGVPIMIPINTGDPHYYSYFDPSFGTGVSHLLVMHPGVLRYPPRRNTYTQLCLHSPNPITPIFGDIQDMQASAELFKASGCDSMFATVTTAVQFAPIAEEHAVADKIRLISLASETLTDARREQLERSYKNALIGNSYASTEMGRPTFFTCPVMMRNKTPYFHVITEVFSAIELVDGELVITYGLNRATPLIRYGTGDYFEEVIDGCACGRPGPVLAWSHRDDVERVRLNGAQFDVSEFERALASLPHLSRPEYQVHFYPESEGAVSIVVEIVDASLACDSDRSAYYAEMLRSELPDVWRLSPTATVRTALNTKLFFSLSVLVVPEVSVLGLKTKRFINHVK